MKLGDLHPKRFFVDAWREADEEAARHRATSRDSRGDALMALYIFVVVAISLTLQDYLGGPDTFYAILDLADGSDASAPAAADPFAEMFTRESSGSLYYELDRGGYLDLWNLGYWASWRVFGFLVLPLIAIAGYPRLRRQRLGLSFAGFSKHVWVYGVLFLPVLIAVVIVSFTEDFSTYYPFYQDAHRSLFDFAVWEAFYVAQFFALEFFFRGFMLQPLRKIMGSSAIFAMMVPYVMIHYGKPLPECFAAIIAGIVLGTLAIRTRSIWAGFLIHVSVAISMDVAAIWQTHW